jgi:hypothetical protein
LEKVAQGIFKLANNASKMANELSRTDSDQQPRLVEEDNTPSLHWPLERIESFPSKHDKTRVVKVKINAGTYKSRVIRVLPLPIE